MTSDFYGRPPEEVAFSVARWFSRGGTLLNHYMFFGGTNFGRFAGASVTTAYAQDAPVCPDLLPHEPVFSHLARLYRSLAACAGVLLSQPAQLDHGVRLGTDELTGFDYGAVAFLENAGDQAHTVQWRDAEYSVSPRSILLVDPAARRVLFDSADVSGATQGSRVITPVAELSGLRWDVWREPLLQSDTVELPVVEQASPAEMVLLTAGLSEYVYYETSVTADVPAGDAVLRVTTSTSLGLVVWVDGEPVAAAENHDHDAARATVEHAVALNTAFAADQPRCVVILAVAIGGAPNFGFDANSTRMLRGILGDVWLGEHNLTSQTWRMRPGLAGEHWQAVSGGRVPWTPASSLTVPAGTWLRARFSTPPLPPVGEGACLLDLTGLGRGHAFVNGHDVGRFWLLARNDGFGQPSQSFYHVPPDWLSSEHLNELVVFEDEGALDISAVGVATSRLVRPVLRLGGHDSATRKVVPCQF